MCVNECLDCGQTRQSCGAALLGSAATFYKPHFALLFVQLILSCFLQAGCEASGLVLAQIGKVLNKAEPSVETILRESPLCHQGRA